MIFTISIERDDALIDSIAWQAMLFDNDAQLLATSDGPSAHDVLIAIAREVDHRTPAVTP